MNRSIPKDHKHNNMMLHVVGVLVVLGCIILLPTLLFTVLMLFSKRKAEKVVNHLPQWVISIANVLQWPMFISVILLVIPLVDLMIGSHLTIHRIDVGWNIYGVDLTSHQSNVYFAVLFFYGVLAGKASLFLNSFLELRKKSPYNYPPKWHVGGTLLVVSN